METMSSRWTFSSSRKIFGCGIDSERVERFGTFRNSEDRPFPFVFAPGEHQRLLLLEDPPNGFCAAFCCKEAVHKAVGAFYDYTQCVLQYEPWRRIAPIQFADEFLETYAISGGIARIQSQSTAGEITVSVVLFE